MNIPKDISEYVLPAYTPIPNPGSPEAVSAGCRCPVMDNGHGRGYIGQTGIFVMSADCPLHGGKVRND